MSFPLILKKIALYKKTNLLGLFTFTKANRLLSRSDFIRLSAVGKKIDGSYFLAVYSPSRRNRTRLGITVTKKIGHAAARNRIKRIIREYFRLNRHKIAGNWDINIIAKNGSKDLSSLQVFSSMQRIFEKFYRRLDY